MKSGKKGSKFIPEAEALLPGVSQKILNSDLHKWKKGLSKKEIDVKTPSALWGGGGFFILVIAEFTSFLRRP